MPSSAHVHAQRHQLGASWLVHNYGYYYYVYYCIVHKNIVHNNSSTDFDRRVVIKRVWDNRRWKILFTCRFTGCRIVVREERSGNKNTNKNGCCLAKYLSPCSHFSCTHAHTTYVHRSFFTTQAAIKPYLPRLLTWPEQVADRLKTPPQPTVFATAQQTTIFTPSIALCDRVSSEKAAWGNANKTLWATAAVQRFSSPMSVCGLICCYFHKCEVL